MNRSRSPILLVTAGLLALMVSPARADLSFLSLSANGTAITQWHNPLAAIDEFDLTGYGLVDDFSWGVTVVFDGGASQTTHRTYQPMKIRVRMSAAVIELAGALQANRRIDASIVTFERDANDGTLTERYTYQLTEARLTGLDIYTVQEQGEPVTYAEFGVIAFAWGIEDAVTQASFEDDWLTVATTSTF